MLTLWDRLRLRAKRRSGIKWFVDALPFCLIFEVQPSDNCQSPWGFVNELSTNDAW
jgi:hypothetical protein